jgi:hypothetical protein
MTRRQPTEGMRPSRFRCPPRQLRPVAAVSADATDEPVLACRIGHRGAGHSPLPRQANQHDSDGTHRSACYWVATRLLLAATTSATLLSCLRKRSYARAISVAETARTLSFPPWLGSLTTLSCRQPNMPLQSAPLSAAEWRPVNPGAPVWAGKACGIGMPQGLIRRPRKTGRDGRNRLPAPGISSLHGNYGSGYWVWKMPAHQYPARGTGAARAPCAADH